jgi:hypothetical protein
MSGFKIHYPGTEADGFSPIGNIVRQIKKQIKVRKRILCLLCDKFHIQGECTENGNKGNARDY